MVLVVLKVLEVRSWGSESRVASKLGHHVLMAFRKRGGGQTQPIPEDAKPKVPPAPPPHSTIISGPRKGPRNHFKAVNDSLALKATTP
jgi:hypothetical protein